MLAWASGCTVDFTGTRRVETPDGGDAASGCMAGFVDLDGMPGCECEISTETCNGMDDDCDRSTDEGIDEDIAEPCGDAATCTSGTRSCIGGMLGMCVPDVVVELCGNGMDDDCDTAVDEDCECTPVGSAEACGSAVGTCTSGARACLATGWGTCEGGTLPSTETCDNEDEDCDGTVDEGVVRACGTDVGMCTAGTEACSRGSFRMCDAVGPVAEQCDAARLDENCDGIVNEGCLCVEGEARACACGGVETCDLTGTFGACVGGTSGTEVCNAIDDDCDGTTDEGTTCGLCTQMNRGTRSYLFCSTVTRSWASARAHCMMFGYDLVTVEDAAENDWLNGVERAAAGGGMVWWYGGTDSASEGTWGWEPTVTLLGYMDWSGGEPDGGTSQNCLSNESRFAPEWSSSDCSDDERFVCEDQDS